MGLLIACSAEPAEPVVPTTAALTNGPVLLTVPDDGSDFQVEGNVDVNGTVSGQRVTLTGGTVVAGFDPSSLPRKVKETLAPRNKISSPLAVRLRPKDGTAKTEVVVSVAHDAPFSLLPRLLRGESRTSQENTKRLASRASAIAAIEARRKPFRDKISARARGLGAVVSEELTMGNGLVMTIPDSAVAALADEPNVLEIVPRFGGTPPPSKISDGTSLSTGMNSDFWRPWNDGSFQYFYMGLLDTGVRSTHAVFTAFDSGVFGLHRDCSNTTNSTCLNIPTNDSYNDQDVVWDHGTGTADIIMGGNSTATGFGVPFRGVSKVELDYFNVYGLYSADAAAVSRAFIVAANFGDDVIIGELQMADSDASAESLAADDAFDQGIAVIAAQGNNNVVTAPAAPGNAHKALAVGDYDAVSGSTVAQFTGPIDGRWKPDFQAPTNVDVASAWGDLYTHAGFNGTSGATAFAAGAAAIMYEWYAGFGLANKPGNLYTALLAQGNGGTQPGTPAGTGKLKLRSGSQWWTGQVTLGTSQINLTWPLPAGRKNLKVAIWWPEKQSDAHDDVDLAILDTAGHEVGRSAWGGSVWEKVEVPGNLVAGTYTFQIIPYHMPRTTQVVYYTGIADYQ